ncbi:DEAD/DEAH box helicase family protein [Geodermatophilus sp. CPCC 205761]|uniref:DEAD/DEAH box helicase family protein n=1 Tax=Geodermatophilus sp. CPCC 205761 TaxID=2936597 RepID=UPI003EEE5FD6
MEITYDEALIFEIAARFDLREPNRRALDAVVQAIVAAGGEFTEMVADLATGVGKTFLMSSLVEYLATQGVRNVLVVTPNTTIQNKTIANFDAASAKYVSGAEIAPLVVTPENFQTASVGAALRDSSRLKVFVFNIQQLIRPTDKVSRRVREEDENLGGALYSYLENTGDLFVIADEHHIYHERAQAFSAAMRQLHPVALAGLTATPDPADISKIVFEYTLGEAIADGHVKIPVIVYRKDGQKDERTQLADACHLLRQKEVAYQQYRDMQPGAPKVRPVLFVVCQTIEHATEVGQLLAGSNFIGDAQAVLEITSESSEKALQALADVEDDESPIRAIVSVNKLREGWDVKNIAVIVALRRLASQTLTEQILGRGLRLPFGERTGVSMVDQVDLVAHDSYQQLLQQKDQLRTRLQTPAALTPVDEHGAATGTEPLPAGDSASVVPDASQGGEAVQPGIPGIPVTAPAQPTLFGLDGEVESDSDSSPSLLFEEVEARQEAAAPEAQGRTEGAPQINFPREATRLVITPFSLVDVPDGDAEAAGARFILEVPTFIYRDALVAKRTGADVRITVTPQANAEAQQVYEGIDMVRLELSHEIMRQPEVTAVRREANAARRLVNAFLKGAGVSSSEQATAEWGRQRRHQAVEGLRTLIRSAIGARKQERQVALESITLPIEPVLVDPNAPNAYNDPYVKGVHFQGWRKSVMPTAAFDAKTTEWELAHLLDRDDEITWWLRLYTNGPAFIPTDTGRYFPDFIAIDKHGTYWVIEGKADSDAKNADVLAKKVAAERWARLVRDEEDYGTWRYMFVTESNIKSAAGSWNGLYTAANPE